MKLIPEHPAKYTQPFIPIFAKILQENNCSNVLDPFAGVGKIGLVKEYGWGGQIYANDIETEWLEPNLYDCDFLTYEDAAKLKYSNKFFDAICTSPTYGNRMADHHHAKDKSKRNTYTHCLGHDLQEGNTGKMQWGKEYRDKHIEIYSHIIPTLKDNGIFILNISDHIRKGEIVYVCDWHREVLISLGLSIEKEMEIKTPRNKMGRNGNLRVEYEMIYVFRK